PVTSEVGIRIPCPLCPNERWFIDRKARMPQPGRSIGRVVPSGPLKIDESLARCSTYKLDRRAREPYHPRLFRLRFGARRRNRPMAVVSALINPNVLVQRNDPFTTGIIYMPIGLAYVAASLRASELPVKVIDAFGEAPRNVRKAGDFMI